MFQFPILLVLQLVVDEKKLIVTNEVGLALPKSVVHFKQNLCLGAKIASQLNRCDVDLIKKSDDHDSRFTRVDLDGIILYQQCWPWGLKKDFGMGVHACVEATVRSGDVNL